jgi:hypothetical protein
MILGDRVFSLGKILMSRSRSGMQPNKNKSRYGQLKSVLHFINALYENLIINIRIWGNM